MSGKKRGRPAKKQTALLRVTEKVVRAVYDKEGKRTLQVFDWKHTVKVNGKLYEPGDTFEAENPETFVSTGVAQYAKSKSTPFRSPHLDFQMQMLAGIEQRENLENMIPAGILGTNEKGWTEVQEDEF